MRNFELLLERCKCGVYLTVNEHRGYYLTAEEELSETEYDIEHEVRSKMIDTDTIVNLHFYPDTPIGFYEINHYDVNAAIDKALSILGIKCE